MLFPEDPLLLAHGLICVAGLLFFFFHFTGDVRFKQLVLSAYLLIVFFDVDETVVELLQLHVLQIRVGLYSHHLFIYILI